MKALIWEVEVLNTSRSKELNEEIDTASFSDTVCSTRRKWLYINVRKSDAFAKSDLGCDDEREYLGSD